MHLQTSSPKKFTGTISVTMPTARTVAKGIPPRQPPPAKRKSITKKTGSTSLKRKASESSDSVEPKSRQRKTRCRPDSSEDEVVVAGGRLEPEVEEVEDLDNEAGVSDGSPVNTNLFFKQGYLYYHRDLMMG